jgi:hypothetical protein
MCRCALVTMGSMFQDLLWLCETADNTECYFLCDIRIVYIHMVCLIDE